MAKGYKGLFSVVISFVLVSSCVPLAWAQPENTPAVSPTQITSETTPAIVPEQDLSSEDANSASYIIEDTPNNSELGWTMGNASKRLGNRVKLIAQPYANHQFIGWYKGEELVSSEEDLYIKATEDFAVFARFE